MPPFARSGMERGEKRTWVSLLGVCLVPPVLLPLLPLLHLVGGAPLGQGLYPMPASVLQGQWGTGTGASLREGLDALRVAVGARTLEFTLWNREGSASRMSSSLAKTLCTCCLEWVANGACSIQDIRVAGSSVVRAPQSPALSPVLGICFSLEAPSARACQQEGYCVWVQVSTGTGTHVRAHTGHTQD